MATAAALAVSVGLPAHADNGTDTAPLREAVSAEGIIEHLEALQAIADANGGTRAAGTPGYQASAQYVEQQLRNAEVLEQTADAIAHATLTFAETTSAVNGTAKGGGSGVADLQFKGAHALK
jgi:hypothetical protein